MVQGDLRLQYFLPTWPRPSLRVTAIHPKLWLDVTEIWTSLRALLLAQILCFFLSYTVKKKWVALYGGWGGGSLTYIFTFDLWNYHQPFSVFLQCINYAQQEPSDSFVFIISASSEPSKSLICCISQCSSLFWHSIHFKWRKFNNNHLHQSSFYLLVWCFSFPLPKIQTELQTPSWHSYLE